MLQNIEQLSDVRRNILEALKRNGPVTIAELANRFAMTGEAIRQHLLILEKEGWVERKIFRASHGAGRPSTRYRLTSEGEHLFPKNYVSLAVEVIDTITEHFGQDALRHVLESMTEHRVREWEPRVNGLSLSERVNVLRDIYQENDAYMEIEQSGDQVCLIEKNCPFLNVAKRRPALCSVTVSAFTRLLGCRVVREERFQNGDGRCVFRVLVDQPIDPETSVFSYEDENLTHS
ncbi:winged helix-turn-helix transcriptional regulator [Fodinisporobacter ferrooxydans]|uniref:Winged helix-turn-helix transcriptional regulator n=1 Tax=Fodinisporobacter ferrooxydans TaxID=2901836 RepID=A0ABY4CEZ3_9BACL|nr:winged helix-turn-helix transcriptional regulator [Alicyclobacillaceae bacterium MYW30-H2]